MSENTIDVLEIGGNKYTKVKYSPLDISEIATEYISYISQQNMKGLNELYRNALLKVSVNGCFLDSEMKINEHFAQFPGELREVRTWALMEGLQSFLGSFCKTPDLEEKYLKPSAEN